MQANIRSDPRVPGARQEGLARQDEGRVPGSRRPQRHHRQLARRVQVRSPFDNQPNQSI